MATMSQIHQQQQIQDQAIMELFGLKCFDQNKGFDVLFFILKMRSRNGSPFSDVIYSALLELVFLPDAISFLTDIDIEGPVALPDTSLSSGRAGSGSTLGITDPPSLLIFSGEGGRADRGGISSMSAEARTVCLRCAAEHAITRTVGKEPWIKSYSDTSYSDLQNDTNVLIFSSSSSSSSSLSLIDRCSQSSPAAVLLLLRLLPLMSQNTAKRTLSELRLSISPRSGALYGSAKTWGDKLRELSANALISNARAFEVRIARYLTKVYDESNSTLLISIEKEGHYLLHNLLWGSLLVPSYQIEGWRSFQRLLCLNPNSSGSLEKTRLLISTLFEGSFEAAASAERRARSLPSSAIDNVIRLTALVEREVHTLSQVIESSAAEPVLSTSHSTSACSLVRACVLYWDSHLAYHAASEDISTALLERTPLLGDIPVGLRSLLLSLSLWQLHAYAPSHHDLLPCLIRLQRLVPTSILKPITGLSTSDINSSSIQNVDDKHDINSSSDQIEESVEHPENGYLGLSPETWQLITVHHLRLFLLEIRTRVVTAQTEACLIPESTITNTVNVSSGNSKDYLDSLSASSNIAISTLESLMNDHPLLLSPPSSSSSSSSSSSLISSLSLSMRALLDRHRLRMRRDGRARAAASSLLSPSESDSIPESGEKEEWEWIMPFSSPFTPTTTVSRSISFLDDPSWNTFVQPALLSFEIAQKASHGLIDRMKIAVSQGIFLTVVKPDDDMHLSSLDELKNNLKIDRQTATTNIASQASFEDRVVYLSKQASATESSISSSSGINPESVRNNVLSAMGAGMAFARSGAERVGSVVSAGIQRGISGFAALAASVEAESEAEMELHALHGRSYSNSNFEQGKIEKNEEGSISVPFSLFSSQSLDNSFTFPLTVSSPMSFSSPRWWDAQWREPAAAVRISLDKLCSFEHNRRIFGISYRSDVLSSVRLARQSILSKNECKKEFDLLCQSKSCATNLSSTIDSSTLLLPLRLSTVETSHRSRIRLELDPHPTDYSSASYDFKRGDIVTTTTTTIQAPMDPSLILVPSNAKNMTRNRNKQSSLRSKDQDEDQDEEEDVDDYDDDNNNIDDTVCLDESTMAQIETVSNDKVTDSIPNIDQERIVTTKETAVYKSAKFAISPGEYLQSFGTNNKNSTQIECKRITPEGVICGIVRISNLRIFFDPILASTNESSSSSSPFSSSSSSSSSSEASSTSVRVTKNNKYTRDQPSHQRWSLLLLTSIRQRRFMLKPSAAEFFFHDGASLFLDFPAQRVKDVMKLLRSRRMRPSVPFLARHESDIAAAAERASIKWANRELSNYEYLMELNSLAGRTYNDLTQYFVMPWVISDYTSLTLDLEDIRIYRDLSLPMGALNPTRLASFKERMEGMPTGEGLPPPFLYGSHYSSAGALLYYLIRLEPFTSLAVDLQSGHFDVADRLFFSVKETWRGVNHSMSDVKELIPEWYTTPEMFVNSRKLPLGRLQRENLKVDHVELPPWANGSPHTFVQINRAALESEYVSSRLHLWIDLIFGNKQRSVEANNVFFHLTYEGEVNVDAIQDKMLRDAVEAQIVHFGQTPSCLFTSPHRPRLPKEASVKSLISPHLPLRFPICIPSSQTSSQILSSQAKQLVPNIDIYTLTEQPNQDVDMKAALFKQSGSGSTTISTSGYSSSSRMSPASNAIVLLATLGPRFSIGGTVRGSGTVGRIITGFGGKYASVHHFLPSFSPDLRLPFEFKYRPPVILPGSSLSVWEGGNIKVSKTSPLVRLRNKNVATTNQYHSLCSGSALSVCELMYYGASAFGLGPATAPSSISTALLYKSSSITTGGDSATLVNLKSPTPSSSNVGGGGGGGGGFSLSSTRFPTLSSSLINNDPTSPGPPTSSSTSSSSSGASIENENDSALVFSCGYSDGSLRWQRFAAGGSAATSPLLGAASGGISQKADLWNIRDTLSLPGVSRASDVSCVSTDEGLFGGLGGLGLHYIISGHTDGRANIFKVSFIYSSLMTDTAPDGSFDMKARMIYDLENRKIGQESVCSDITGDAHSQLADSGRHSILAIHGASTSTLLVRIAELVPLSTGFGGLLSAATCVALSMSNRLAAVGTASGKVQLFDSRTGQILQSILSPSSPFTSVSSSSTSKTFLNTHYKWTPVHHIALLLSSSILIHWIIDDDTVNDKQKDVEIGHKNKRRLFSKKSQLSTYSINGTHLATSHTLTNVWITSMTATKDSEAILIGSSDGHLTLWHAHTLSRLHTFPTLKLHKDVVDNYTSHAFALTLLPPEATSCFPKNAITSILLVDNEQVILVGTGDGRLILCIDSSRQNEALVKRQLEALLI
jgi:hypothetical protein